MIWHLAKREIFDNLTRFRFALTLILLIVLMVMNAVIFVSSKYQRRIAAYSQDTNAAIASLKERSSSLGELAVKGPGNLYKRPSPLGFIATGADANLPKQVTGNAASGGSWSAPNFYYSCSNNWSLEYPQDVVRKNDALPNFTELDWTFIIGLVMSFMAILFTYDAISTEREAGTLSLLMSNSVSRATVLLAKFIGAFLTILLPVFIGILLNLMIVNASDLVSLDGGEWGRVGIICVISAIYISMFLWLGLFISSLFSNSSSSLLVLLLIWVVFVVLIPNTMGTLASGFRQVPSKNEVSRLKQEKLDEINDLYLETGKRSRLFQVYLVKEGLSQRPVTFNSIPKFSEQMTLSLTLRGALLDLTLLVSLGLLLVMAASLAFLRSDIR